MRALAHFIVKKSVAWVVIAVVLLVGAACAIMASRVKQDDDILAFLPKDNPEVSFFYQVNKRFGGLDVALVGIGADDVFSPDFLARVQKVTKSLNQTEGIGYALSLTNVEDFVPDAQKGGIALDYLVPRVPANAQEQAALRDKVMGLDHVVGNLVSRDGKAIVIYCFGGYGADPKTMASRIRDQVNEAFPNEPKYWGGAPFISTYIYGVTQDDVRKLSPWAVAVIILITLISFRDIVGTALALLSTALGIAFSVGLMGLLDVHGNIVLGSMPVILFALGSAYSVHILTRYYRFRRDHDGPSALTRTLRTTGAAVLASGLTTVAGLLSFVMMDIAPLRTFGLFTAIGVLVAMLLALTFVPAVIRIFDMKGKAGATGTVNAWTVRLCTAARQRRLLTGAILGALVAGGFLFGSRVETRMDNAAFFSKGSPPDLAETFLKDHFGGSQFIQVHLDADMTNPHVLRKLVAIADRVSLLPHVASVNHLGMVVAQSNDAMTGDRRIPDSEAKIKLLYGFLAGKHAVSQFVTDDRKESLMQVKVSSNDAREVQALLAAVRDIVQSEVPSRFVVVDVSGPRKAEAQAKLQAMVLDRILAIAAQAAVAMPSGSRERLANELSTGSRTVDPQLVEAALARYLRSEENIVELPDEPPDLVQKTAAALAALGPKPSEQALTEALVKALDKPAEDPLVDDLASSIDRPLQEISAREGSLARAKRLIAGMGMALPEGPRGPRFVAAIAGALRDLDEPAVLLAAGAEDAANAGTMTAQVTGLPVLHQGLSASVNRNQVRSLAFSLGVVLVILMVLYRSVWSGLLGTAPTVLTLIVVYGAMGVRNVHLDIGTSMLASLIIGAGVDYGVHLMAEWNAPEGQPILASVTRAANVTGPSIWTNAIMVCAGFFVLTLGEARPLQNVGGLTAAAMVVAALATFVSIPVLAGKYRYIRPADLNTEAAGTSYPDAVIGGTSPE